MAHIIPFHEESYNITKFTSDKFLYHMNQCLKTSFENKDTINEIRLDIDDLMYPDCSAKKWCIKLHNMDEINKASYLRESYYVVPRYEVHITFTDCIDNLGHNVYELENLCNVRNDDCNSVISTIEYYIRNPYNK